MIYGYPEEPSVVPGGRLTLRVSTDASAFQVRFLRQGATLADLGDLGLGTLPGSDVPFGPPDQDWRWPGYDVAIPPDWPPGVYVAVLSEVDSPDPDVSTVDGRDGRALFVVRRRDGASGAPILYKLPLFTWHAYNMTGEPMGSLYTGTHDRVSLRRPGGGTGGTPTDAERYPDVYDLDSPRETFAHWDAGFIAWLEGAGYQVDYCTDLDLHRGTDGLSGGCRLLVTAGHDEYWTAAMRERVAGFVDRGGNLAVFSGNTCWWRVDLADADPGGPGFGRSGPWHELGEPENRLIGVSYRNAGGQWYGGRPEVVGYTVQYADHWVYQGTGLKDGDVFGDTYDDGDEPAALVGYECDGAAFDRAAFVGGGPVEPSLDDGTPPGFTILGVADVTGWADYDGGNRAATMGVFTRNGTVFNAATSDWPRVLASGRCAAVERITRNVLDTLSREPPA